jgi:hypothetical protein
MAEERRYYVSMTDKFMSGWGEARDKINKLVFICDSYSEAIIVRDNARNRTDQIYINICINKPYYNKRDYLTQYKTKGDYNSWYEKDFFKDRKEVE